MLSSARSPSLRSSHPKTLSLPATKVLRVALPADDGCLFKNCLWSYMVSRSVNFTYRRGISMLLCFGAFLGAYGQVYAAVQAL